MSKRVLTQPWIVMLALMTGFVIWWYFDREVPVVLALLMLGFTNLFFWTGSYLERHRDE